MANFIERVHELPRELFDLIYDFTFSSDATEPTVSKDYKPPTELHVDLVSRSKFAESYYIKTFNIAPQNHGPVATKWLSSLPQTYIDMIAGLVVRKLHAYGTSCDCFVPEQSQATLARFRLKDWESELKLKRCNLPVEKLYLRSFGKLWSFDSYRQLKVVVDDRYPDVCRAPSCAGKKD